MTKNGEKAISLSSLEEDFPVHFSEWLKRRRQEFDLTQEQLAQRASCSVFAIRKIETGERRPSKQLAELLAQSLEIPLEDQGVFVKAARGEVSVERLASPVHAFSSDPQTDTKLTPLPGSAREGLKGFAKFTSSSLFFWQNMRIRPGNSSLPCLVRKEASLANPASVLAIFSMHSSGIPNSRTV